MTFAEMQAGELAWWRAFLAHPQALGRLFAVYGYRYLDFFFDQLVNVGAVIDFGSGPVSAAFIAHHPPAEVVCVDPLFADYREAGLVYGPAILAPQPIPAGTFDTALVLNVLDHTEEPAALVAAAAASLKRDGYALLWVHIEAPPDSLHVTVHAEDVYRWVRDAGLSMPRTRRSPGHGGPEELAVLGVKWP